MKTLIALIVVVLIAALVAPACADGIAKASKPLVIVFETVAGEGADKVLAASTTKALCTYLRESQQVEATVFDRESATVLRAIMDKQLTADQVASYSSRQERIGVAKALAYDYAAGAEISIHNGIVQVKVWMGKSNGGKKDKWEASAEAATGGGDDRNYDNAMQSATSAAVISIGGQALAGLPAVAAKQPTTGAETTAIGADEITPPAQPSAAEYVAQGDASVTAGSLAQAIGQYQQAVNAEPSNAALRLKLVGAYARKSMFEEANAELDKASKMGASADQIAAAKKQIEDLRGGQGTLRATAQTPPEPEVIKGVRVAPEEPAEAKPSAVPKTAVELIREGDKLWHANKPDEAADAYREAIKANASEWRAYERLALVDASMSLFAESRKMLELLAQLQPNPTVKLVSNRYQLFSKVFEQWFTTLFKQYDRDSADYQKHIITRESYYNSIKGLAARLESMAKFLDALQVPPDKKPASLHLGLACGLVTQAALSLQDSLETNSAESKSNAETFVAQAKKELEAAQKLEGSPVVAEKQPEAAPAPTAPAPSNEDQDQQPADMPQ